MAYLNEDGLNRFWGNFKNTFPYKSLRYEDIDVSVYASKYGNDFSITPYALHSDIINTESFSGFLLKENLSDVTSVDIGTKIAVYMNSYTSSSSLSTGILSWVSDHYVCATGDESTLKIGYDSSNKTPFPASNKNLVFSLDESMSINSSAESKIYILEYIKYLPEGTSTYKYGWIVTDILQSKHIDTPDIPVENVEKTVKFIDYDGTVIVEYTPEEALALTALPACPTHTGLTSQGWNYTLAEVKSQASAMGSCIVGHNLVTDDGNTRLYIKLDDSKFLSPSIGLGVNGTLTIDWGDGAATGTLTGTSLTARKTISHTYSSIGEYTITITPSSGTTFQTIVSGTGVGTYWLFDYSQSLGLDSTNTSIVYSKCIKHVELGTGISQLSSYAFQNCIELKSITIPSSVTAIGNYAFQNCYSLTSITIPSGVTSIGSHAFNSCYSLTSITIPSGVTSIGTSAFQYCYSLTSITIPSGVTSIESSVFSYCYSLTSITIPSGVTSIESSAFSNCYSITSITIPSVVTSIGSSAFQNCYSLKSLSIPSGVTSIGAYTFSYCFALESITIPSSVTSIGNYAFNYCYLLTSITIPSGVTSIGTYAFQNCYSLTSITIPSGVTSIGTSVFQNCYSLTSIIIPSGVTSIGTYAFQQGRSIYNYYIYPTNPPTLSDTSTFTGIQAGAKIHVPAASLSSYQTAQYWSSYSSYMVGDL